MNTTSDIPATIDVNPSGNHPAASIIWLHGLGADGNDFLPIVERFKSLEQYKIRFVFPQAPIRAITVNGGMPMRGWYDIADTDITVQEDDQGIRHSERLIQLLIEREQAVGIKSRRIILAGFSQGGAVALHTGLRFNTSLGGIIALSAYLPIANEFSRERAIENQSTPIFMAHGIFDPVVPLTLGQTSKERLESMGYVVHWHSYSMAHSVVPEELAAIEQFLNRILSDSALQD